MDPIEIERYLNKKSSLEEKFKEAIEVRQSIEVQGTYTRSKITELVDSWGNQVVNKLASGSTRGFEISSYFTNPGDSSSLVIKIVAPLNIGHKGERIVLTYDHRDQVIDLDEDSMIHMDTLVALTKEGNLGLHEHKKLLHELNTSLETMRALKSMSGRNEWGAIKKILKGEKLKYFTPLHNLLKVDSIGIVSLDSKAKAINYMDEAILALELNIVNAKDKIEKFHIDEIYNQIHLYNFILESYRSKVENSINYTYDKFGIANIKVLSHPIDENQISIKVDDDGTLITI